MCDIYIHKYYNSYYDMRVNKYKLYESSVKYDLRNKVMSLWNSLRDGIVCMMVLWLLSLPSRPINPIFQNTVSFHPIICVKLPNNSDYHTVLGGDLNVDFCRDWAHTALLNNFGNETGLTPVIRHAACTIVGRGG